MNVKIVGTGSAVPKLRVTNDDLSRLMDTSDEWIKTRTGIENRHLAVEETPTGWRWRRQRKRFGKQELRRKNWD